MNKIVSTMCVLLSLGLSLSAHAENWQKILSCEGGSAHMDVNADDRESLQLVINGNDLLNRMYQAGMIGLQYGQQEYILRGQHAELKQDSPTTTRPFPLGGVFYSHDFKKMIWQNYNGSAIEVELRGSDLDFKLLGVNAGTSCTGDFEGECQGAVYHTTYYFIRDYVLRDCHLQ